MSAGVEWYQLQALEALAPVERRAAGRELRVTDLHAGYEAYARGLGRAPLLNAPYMATSPDFSRMAAYMAGWQAAADGRRIE